MCLVIRTPLLQMNFFIRTPSRTTTTKNHHISVCPSGFQYKITLSVNHINQQLLPQSCLASVVVIIRAANKKRWNKKKANPLKPVSRNVTSEKYQKYPKYQKISEI